MIRQEYNNLFIPTAQVEFFREEHFLVGISVDGFKDLHNRNRVDAEGHDTWNRVVKTVRLLQRHHVETNALCVVTGGCARSPEKAYNGLKKLGFSYIQFIACIDPIGMERGQLPFSLTPDAYGAFLCRVFDLWYHDWISGQYHSVRLFDDYIHILMGDSSSTCATCGCCNTYFVVEGDGSVYPCDFFVLDDWQLGKLDINSLAEMVDSEPAKRFLLWGQDKPMECAACPWGNICNGGCKNDWIELADGIHNYYCRSFHALLDYAMPRMIEIARAEYLKIR